MKILIINKMLGTILGGGETFDLTIARMLTRLDNEVTVVTGRPFFSPPLFYPDLKVIYLRAPILRSFEEKARYLNNTLGTVCRYLDNLIFEHFVFSWLLRNQKYYQFQIVQCCSMFWLPKWLIQTLGIPVVSWLPGPPSRLVQKQLRSLVRYPHFGLFTHGDPVRILENQLGFVRGMDFEIIEPGVDIATAKAYDSKRNSIRNNLLVPPELVVGVTIARLIAVKNIPFLLRGIQIATQNPKIHLIWYVVGNGPEHLSLKKLAIKMGLQRCVHWLGQLPQSGVHEILKAADVFALTSSYESFSIATLEAMAHGLPVVATDVGFLSTIVKESHGGILVKLGDDEGLAQAIIKLATDGEYRQQLGANGRSWVEQFDWSNTIKKLLEFYKRVLNKR